MDKIHFNTQQPDRTALLRDLSEALGKTRVSTSLWACLQVCDISQLETLVELSYFSPNKTIEMLDICPNFPRKWLENHSVLQSIASGASNTSRDSLSKCMRIVARKRDGYRCILTGAKTYQPVWIFSEALTRPGFYFHTQTSDIWRFMDLFWEPSRVQRWHTAVFNNPDNAPNSTSGCSSLICLQTDLAYGFASGMFALRPVQLSADKRELEVEFHWLSREKHHFNEMVDIRQQPLSYRGLERVDELEFYAAGSNELVKSGHRFHLTTDDPVQRPLPDFDLLDMAWNIARVVAMSSAIEMACSESEHQSDDDQTVRGFRRPSNCMFKPSSFDTSTQRVAEWLASGISGHSN